MSFDRLRLLSAFFAIYVIWGSTYLAITFLIDTLPGFIMVGLRFVLGGAALYAWARWRGEPSPTRTEWRAASIVGVSLLVCGTGAVVWAADYLPSGLMALLVAMEPLWMALLLWGQGQRPTAITVGALALGFLGAGVLAAPGQALGQPIHLPSALVIAAGAFSWAAGSLYSRRASLPSTAAMNAASQMLMGGVVLLVLGIARGELVSFDAAAVSTRSLFAFVYLMVFGSIVAFSAYAWLIRTVEPTLVATHTFVNPAVAVFLGWWLAGEAVGPRTLVAAGLILTSVIVMTWQEIRHARARRRAVDEAPTPLPAAEPSALDCGLEPALASASGSDTP